MRERDVILAEIKKRIAGHSEFVDRSPHFGATKNPDRADELTQIRDFILSLPQHEPSELCKEAREKALDIGVHDIGTIQRKMLALCDALDASERKVFDLDERLDMALDEERQAKAALGKAREALEILAKFDQRVIHPDHTLDFKSGAGNVAYDAAEIARKALGEMG